MKNVLNSKAAMVGVGVAVAALAIYFIAKKSAGAAGDAFGKFGEAINPINRENVFYTSVNAVGGAVTGDQDFSLGSRIYDAVDTVSGWFGMSDADKMRRAEEAARQTLNQDERWLKMDNAEGIG